MKKIVFSEVGGPEVLRLVEAELPEPGPGEVRVRHQAIGVNFIDIYHRTGLYPAPLPSGLGLEAAGEIDAIGEGVSGFALGDRVAYATGPIGAYAEARVIDPKYLVRLPEGIASSIAAATLLKGMTAEYLIRRTVRVERGDWVLFHAAAGGVGLLACEWLVKLGARVIATVSTEAKAEVVRSLGVEHVVLYSKEDFVARSREITDGKGVRVVYDSVGLDTFERSLDCLALRGTLVGFGNASGKPPMMDPMKLAKGSFFLTRATLFHYAATREDLELSSGTFFQAVLDGLVNVRAPKELPLAQAAEAHRALAGRETIGSTILVP